MNIINWWQSGGSMGEKPEGWSEQDVQNYIDRFYLNKSSSKPEAPSTQDLRLQDLTMTMQDWFLL